EAPVLAHAVNWPFAQENPRVGDMVGFVERGTHLFHQLPFRIDPDAWRGFDKGDRHGNFLSEFSGSTRCPMHDPPTLYSHMGIYQGQWFLRIEVHVPRE